MLFDDREYFTVSELNERVRVLLEENYSEVAVLGEISNYRRHTSGHLYLTLKDAASQLRAVCFRGDAERLGVELEDGLMVVARGRLTLYEVYGQYQLVIYQVEPAGAGALERAFRALREKLEREGLFAAENKKALPPYPFRIGVVTSRTGAAVRDIVSTLRRRWPVAGIYLYPVRVQGEGAAEEIAEALDRLSERGGLDILIVGRGGGSLEDLWAFNEETVARAIHRCSLPVISAVGHETDFTIADFVADARAATPTMAAEIAVPRIDEVLARLDQWDRRLVDFIGRALEMKRVRLEELLRSYALGQVRGLIERSVQRHDYAVEKLRLRMTEGIRAKKTALEALLARLAGLDARSVLARGYALCSDPISGALIASAAAAVRSGTMRVTFADGSVVSDVKEKR